MLQGAIVLCCVTKLATGYLQTKAVTVQRFRPDSAGVSENLCLSKGNQALLLGKDATTVVQQLQGNSCGQRTVSFEPADMKESHSCQTHGKRTGKQRHKLTTVCS